MEVPENSKETLEDTAVWQKVSAVVNETLEEMLSQLSPEKAGPIREIFDFRRSISSESDRGAVLMAAAFLDDKLKYLLSAKLVDDKKLARRAFDFNGPLGTFSSRIDFAYLIGVLPKNVHSDLHTIRGIRNKFAHNAASLTLEDQEITELCNRLIFHGVREVAAPGPKFRRSVMALLTFVVTATSEISHLEPAADYPVPDRKDAYKEISQVWSSMTDRPYPIRDQHEE
ncbi:MULTISPECIES: hypothetical protein [unclassified Polaromonas]|uniref:hypothetical protein n=1 Tax=unclassified Polaromonas TaxID=2638319 RepID=UPI000F085CDB|nr:MULTISPECIES: hypothetical protein [unclassified Polaromonas]AYQ26819.1 hypothetical protein DT070_01490 [Polaromonas sp. SP1]QGJ18336.1 hypothetical protein F7R28_07960 [Polaromonas sp. Pch-P]